MTGPQLATLSTILWAILTLAFLIVLGRWSAGESWTILPGIVRGVRYWAAEHAAGRATSPSPWAVTFPAPTPGPADPVRPEDQAQIEELGTSHLR